MQDTETQNNAAISAFLPKALTGFPGLDPASDLISSIDGISPLTGSQQTPGKLLDAVPDSACPAGANALINPVDNSCITKDVLGNDRWDAGGARNIGGADLPAVLDGDRSR